MEAIRLSPYIRIAWDDREEADFNIPWRVIFDYEFIFLKSGRWEVCIDDEKNRFIVEPGDVLTLRPRQRHRLRSISDTPVHQPHIHFDLIEDETSPYVYVSFHDLKDIPAEDFKLFRKDILNEFCEEWPPVIRPQGSQEIERMMMDIIYEYDNRMVHSDYLMQGLFLQLFGTILCEIKWNHGTRKGVHGDIAQQARNYLANNLGRNISLDELADHVHASKYYLSHRFKKTFGVPPIQYHRNMRISRAKYLLVHTRMPIREIAKQTGFQSASLFTKTFQKQEKISPSIYRKN
jgi:AraC-like DNA-binding protein